MISFFISANILAIIFGFLLDMRVGDPRWALHPIRLMGNIISKIEQIVYRKGTFIEGVLLLLITLIILGGVYIGLLVLAWWISPAVYIGLSALGVWTGLSVKDMKQEVVSVINALNENDLPEARKKLSLLVSRDTQQMEKPKIISSAIETVSENFTDAVFSPLFYATIGGGAGVILFKIVSTLDSMVGYRTSRYERFGTASARADDLLGFIPARLSIIPIMFGTMLAGQNPASAWKCYIKHRKDHASPNSAHSIAAFAGALRVTLGGDTSYGGVVYEKPLIVGGDDMLTVEKVKKSLVIYEDGAFFAAAIGIVVLYLLK